MAFFLTLSGRLWKDPEVRHNAKGEAIITLPLVVSYWDGEEKVYWVRGLVTNPKLQPQCNRISKGSVVLAAGELRVESYLSKTANKLSISLTVWVSHLSILKQPKLPQEAITAALEGQPLNPDQLHFEADLTPENPVAEEDEFDWESSPI